MTFTTSMTFDIAKRLAELAEQPDLIVLLPDDQLMEVIPQGEPTSE